MTLFRSRKEFEALQRCLVATQQSTPMRVLAYCVMNNQAASENPHCGSYRRFAAPR
jgi:hypothetical protein